MKTRTWAVLIAVIALISGLLFGFLHRSNPNASTVEIIQDGVVIHRIDLKTVDYAYEITIEDHKGGYNTLLVEPSRICVRHSNCRDQICVSQGWLYRGPQPIVCLPHGLVIQAVEESELDAVAQ